MGSKQGIADEIVKIFPGRTNFYDLFGGGFSISHAMLIKRSKSFQRIHYNEIKKDVVHLVQKAINGDYNYDVFKPEFITREMFFDLKDQDAYVRLIWAFANNQKTYLFGKEIEPYKKSMHNAIIFNEFDDLARQVIGSDKFNGNTSRTNRRLFLRNRIDYYRQTGMPDFLQQIEQMESLKQLQQLEQLERLQQMESLKNLQRIVHLERIEQLQELEIIKGTPSLCFTAKSYEDVIIEDDSIVYCDIPYLETADYDNEFDHVKFFDWAHSSPHPVFISEYNIADSRFKLVKQISKLVRMNNSGDTKKAALEKIYVNKAGYKALLNP